ncbi:MAG: transcription elongation factor Spt5 [Thermoplasmata archaeon]
MGLFGDIEEKPEKPEEKKEAVKEVKITDAQPTPSFGLQIVCPEDKKLVISGQTAKYLIRIVNTSVRDDIAVLKFTYLYRYANGTEGAEWKIALRYMMGEEEKYEVMYTREHTLETLVFAGQNHDVFLELTAPVGVRYGDSVDVVVNLSSKNDPLIRETKTISTTAKQVLIVVKTQIGHEREVADTLLTKSNIDKYRGVIFAILAPSQLRGYLIVEGMSINMVKEMLKGVPKARGIIEEGETSIEEISGFLTPASPVSGINVGDLVEIVSGPFKGERARVKTIESQKEEITVELIDAVVPIPVTVRGDSVKVVEVSEKKEVK